MRRYINSLLSLILAVALALPAWAGPVQSPISSAVQSAVQSPTGGGLPASCVFYWDASRGTLVSASGVTGADSRSTTAWGWNPNDGGLTAYGAGVPLFERADGVRVYSKMDPQHTNLSPYPDPNSTSQLTSSGVSVAAKTWSCGLLTNAVSFGDNSVNRWAYEIITHSIGATYTVSCFVEMSDGSTPVVGTSNNRGDFGLVLDGTLIGTAATVQRILGAVYRVSARKTSTIGGSLNTGVVKYSTQSAKTFAVSGFNVTATSVVCGYVHQAGTTTVNADTNTWAAGAIRGGMPQTAGTALVVWRPGFAKTDLPASATTNVSILGITGAAAGLIYAQRDTPGGGYLVSYDGSTVAPVSLSWSTGTSYYIATRWNNSGGTVAGLATGKMQIGYSLDGITWTWGAATNYDGAFTSDGIVRLGYSTTYPHHFRGAAIYNAVLSEDQIRSEFQRMMRGGGAALRLDDLPYYADDYAWEVAA